MSRKLTTDEVHELAETLQGSANYLESVCMDLFETDDIAIESLQELDQMIFQCEQCGWWMEHSEMTEDPDHDWQCRECVDEEEA